MLTLLAEDVAMIPDDILERAIQRHVASSPYMPKVADLLKHAREIENSRLVVIPRTGQSYAHDLAAEYNARSTRTDIEWFVNDVGEVAIRDKITFNRWNTEEISKRHERERQECSRNNQPRPVGPD